MEMRGAGQPGFNRRCHDCTLSFTTLYQDGKNARQPARCEECYITYRSRTDRHSYATVDEIAARDREMQQEHENSQSEARAKTAGPLGQLPEEEVVKAYNRLRAQNGLMPWEELDEETRQRAMTHAQGSVNSLLPTVRSAVSDALERLATVGSFHPTENRPGSQDTNLGPPPAQA